MLGVVMVHFNGAWQSPSNSLHFLSSIGARCPQLFFIISGFLTWRSIDRNIKKGKFNSLTFLYKRYTKLAPLFYISLILTLIIPYYKLFSVSIINVIANVTFLSGLSPYYINGILGGSWYIADLALFYLLIPFLYNFVNSFKSSLLFLLLFSSLSCAYNVFYGFVLKEYCHTLTLEMYFKTQCIIVQLPVLFMGVVLYNFVENSSKVGKKICLFLAFGGLLIYVVFKELLNVEIFSSSFIAGILFSLLFYLFYLGRNLFTTSGIAWLKKIGINSYGMYCMHTIIINCFFALWRQSIVKDSISAWCISFVLICLTSLVLGILTEKLVELFKCKYENSKNNRRIR